MSVSKTDHDELAGFGYKQELDRSLGKFSSFAAGFSYISILTGVFQLFGFGFSFGGPAYWWTWPIVFVGQFLVALCFAEMAGQFPLAGSVYQWSKQVARPLTSWLAGWIILIGAIVTVAAVAVAYQVILPQISDRFEFIGGAEDIGSYGTPDGAKNAVVLALLLVVFTTVINMIGVKVMAIINNVGVAVELIGATLLVVFLAFHAKRGPGVIMETNNTGDGRTWGYTGAFLLAGIASAYIFYGFDTAGSLAEETNNPRKHAPGAILRAMVAAFVLGALLILFAMMAMKNLTQGNGGLPVIVKYALGDGLGDVFLACSAVAITVCALAVHTAGIRIMFTMARDGRLPFGSKVARVSGTSRTPIVPALVIGVLAVILLLINIGNQQVFLVLTSVAIILFYVAYLCVTGPLLLRRLRGEWPRKEHGPYFSLGRAGLVVNIVAVVYQTVVVVDLAWPRPDVYGHGQAWYFQYGAFVFLGFVVLVGGAYYFGSLHNKQSEVLAEHRALPTG
ncbi:amino acid/polyamine/organocation transporter, APC superfamily [Jatrophihabitans endophyticus]|uniref:Amino acid/polyamine/organocation transporter, APC superfamily n=1 Tax=Jatrophihabitans endophyticus TaxID=1206085 RepID=A0A1M5D9Q2_9ACTN|nr:amino acid permease [Jatrophihabitans endophyticus]SHF63392.1 amino acid/polyamine/organocation transporter, APC superfamily [Jatrophihabitans endophyticus]